MRRLVGQVAYLQVTATPYSLYLQPEDYDAPPNGGYVFKPKKPAFTELLPIHAGYVGGDDYFLAPAEGDPRSFLFVEVQRDEQDALRKEDSGVFARSECLIRRNVVAVRPTGLYLPTGFQTRTVREFYDGGARVEHAHPCGGPRHKEVRRNRQEQWLRFSGLFCPIPDAGSLARSKFPP